MNVEDAEPKTLKPPKLRSLSRSEAKKIRALNTVEINRMVDGKQRALEQTSEELQKTRQKLALATGKLSNACALLEAIVRRHGVQVFDRETVQGICAKGRVTYDVTEDRITLRLLVEPRLVDSE
jgi:methyl coenzyme M reductase beta subunit